MNFTLIIIGLVIAAVGLALAFYQPKTMDDVADWLKKAKDDGYLMWIGWGTVTLGVLLAGYGAFGSMLRKGNAFGGSDTFGFKFY